MYSLQLGLGGFANKLDLVDARPDTFEADLNNIAILEPDWWLLTRSYTLWTIPGQSIVAYQVMSASLTFR